MQRNISIQHSNRSFLETTRIDIWWVGPLLTSIGLLAFIFYSTWAAFRMNTINGGLTFHHFMPLCLNSNGGLCHQHSSFSGLLPVSGSPATITEKPITDRFFLLHLLVRLEQSLRNIAESGFYWFFRIRIAISFILLSFSV